MRMGNARKKKEKIGEKDISKKDTIKMSSVERKKKERGNCVKNKVN